MKSLTSPAANRPAATTQAARTNPPPWLGAPTTAPAAAPTTTPGTAPATARTTAPTTTRTPGLSRPRRRSAPRGPGPSRCDIFPSALSATATPSHAAKNENSSRAGSAGPGDENGLPFGVDLRTLELRCPGSGYLMQAHCF